MNLSNNFLCISGLDKINNSLDQSKNNFSINNLEISQLTLRDNWSLLSELKQLRSLTLRDSYIDFVKFYTAICSLGNLEQLTYNHYCFFNKNQKEALPDNLKLPSLKIFRLEFPDEIEPDFDINTYSQKGYKLRNNSITEVRNCHEVFKNLEEIQFINYQTYKKRMKDYEADKKKLNSSIYWNMDFKTLNKFKSIKNIHFNDGQPNSLLGAGILEIFLDKIPKETKFKFNGISSEIPKDLLKNVAINLNHKKEEETNIRLAKIQKKIKELFNEDSSFQKVVEINLRGLFKINNSKDTWKAKTSKLTSLFFDNQFTTIIFSPAFNFLKIGTDSSYEIKRAGYYLEFFKSQEKIETVVFDLLTDKDQKWEAFQFSFLVKIMHDLLKQNEKIKIYIFHDDLKKIINNEKIKNASFKIHFIYLINFYFNYKKEFDQRIIFPGIREKEMYNFYKNYIQQEVDQIYIVDDKFFESSKKINNIDLFYKEELAEFKNHYPIFFQSYSYEKTLLWEKTLKPPITYQYQEIFRILENPEYDEDYFSAIKKDMLTLVVKKKILKDLKNYNPGNIRKYYSYFGSPWHIINTHMDKNRKKYNIVDVSEESENSQKKLSDAANKTVDSFMLSGEFSDDIKKEEFLTPLENYSYINDPGLNFQVLESTTHCSLEGVRPWGGKYFRLKELDKFLPLNNLEFLRIRDCLAVDELDLPFIPKLKFLHLSPSLNHHSVRQDPKGDNSLRYFENLPSLEELHISGFFSHFKGNLSKSFGDDRFKSDRWRVIEIDFSSLHELKKLKKIKLSKIKASQLNNIVALPAVEDLKINSVFYIDKSMRPDSEGFIEKPITDLDLKFLKKSPNLCDLSLELGQCLCRDEQNTDLHFCYYKGNGNFIDYITHRLKKLKLTINFNEKDNTTLTDIINKICNRFLKLEELTINFGIATNDSNFDWEVYRYKRIPKKKEIDIKKISKIKDLKSLIINNGYHFINYKIVNFRDLIKLKKITNFRCDFKTISFNEFKGAKKLFQNEKYENPKYYDEDYSYMEEEYKKNWTRFDWINTYEDFGDWRSLASQYEDIEKEHDKPKKVIRKKKN